MSSGTRTGMDHSIPKDRDREENEKVPKIRELEGKENLDRRAGQAK